VPVFLLLLALLVPLAGCGGGAPAAPLTRLSGEPSADGSEEPPLVVGPLELPPLPITVHASDEPVAEALRLCSEATLPERPVLADDANAEQTAAFMRERFQPWVVARARAIGAARAALAQIEHGEPDEYVLASGLVGALFARLAQEIAELPLPRIVRDDSEERVLVREALLETAQPLYRRALDALGACAGTAAGAADPSLEAWATWCDDAIERAELAPHPVDAPAPAPRAPAASTSTP
jgi:hypothetical protein